MAVPVQNGYEVFEEEKFADDFVPFLTPIKEIHGKRTARSYISTSSINEKTLPDSLGDELDNTFSQSFVNKTHSDNMRQEHSFLKVDKKEVNVGEVINICWNVAEPCSANDWIGIFKSSDLDPRKFLDHKERGMHTVREGKLSWTISENCVTDPVTMVCFRYFRANGKIAATSENFYIKKEPKEDTDPLLSGFGDLVMSSDIVSGDSLGESEVYYVTISDLSAHGLRASMFGPPSPYLKLTVLQHKLGYSEPVTGDQRKTEQCTSTSSPSWTSAFVFRVSSSDSIELELRDYFVGNSPTQSHFLGKTELWIQDFLTFDLTCTHTLELYKRIPSDNVSGSVTFTVKVSKDTPLPDIDTPPLTLPEPDSHKTSNECIPSDTHFCPKKVPLNDQCPNPFIDREFTPSPIQFCDEDTYPCSSLRSIRECSVDSDFSIRTFDSLDALAHQIISDDMLESGNTDFGDVLQLSPPLDLLQTPVDVDESEKDKMESVNSPSSFVMDHSKHNSVISPTSNKSDEFFSASSNGNSPVLVDVVEDSQTTEESKAQENTDLPKTTVTESPQETREEVEETSVVTTALLVSTQPTSNQASVETKDEPIQKKPPSFEQKRPFSLEEKRPPSLEPSNRASVERKEEPVQKRPPSFEQKRPPSFEQKRPLSLEEKRPPSLEEKRPPSLEPSNQASVETKEEPVQKRPPSFEPITLARRVGTLPANLAPSDIPVVASESSDEDPEREMEVQLNLMRSHLRHSRRRYSMRQRKPKERSGDDVGTLERGSSLHRSATISGARRAYLKGRYSRKPEDTVSVSRDPNPSQSQFLESRVDKHGRTYLMDHKDKTIAYKDEDNQSEMAKRRAQLDRRYLSMKRMKGRPSSERETPPPAQISPVAVASHDLPSEEEAVSPTKEASSPPADNNLRPMGRLRTNTVLTEQDVLAKETVLAKFKRSHRNTSSTFTDHKRKKSEGVLAALKSVSMKRVKRTTYSPTGQQEAAIYSSAVEEDERRKTKIVEEANRQKKVAVEMPGLQFITRKDLYALINSAGPSAQKFLENRSLMELIQRIRADPALFLKYQHSPVIIDMCNMFVDKSMEIPEGWERKLNKDGKAFFVDHNTKKTTYIDPRLPLDGESLPQSLLEALRKEINPEPQAPIPLNPRRVAADSGPQRELPDQPDPRNPQTSQDTTSQDTTTPRRPDVRTDPNTSPPQTSGPPQQRLSYNEQVIEFLRQPDVFTTITGRYRRQLKPELKTLIETLRSVGPSGLESQSEHPQMLELIVILSLFEEDIANIQHPLQLNRVNSTFVKLKVKRERKKKAFEQKLQNFRITLNHLGYAQNNRFRFNMRRDHLLEDAYEHVMKSRIRHLQRKRLDIQFQGEEGLDYGGPSREFFFLVSREIFNPYYGLFEYSANDTYTVQISPTSCFIENNLDWFKFAGRIIGLAIAQGYLLDVFFTRPMYKSLLNSAPTLKDLEAIEPGIYSSLVWIQENDPEPLDLTFTVEEEAFGQLVEHELKEDGGEIQVTEENKTEYIELMLRWRLDRGVQEQTTAFVSGFREIIPGSLVRQFDAQELEFVIAGVLEVDVDDWRDNTDYRAGYSPDHPVVKMFWKAVESFDNEQRLRLLQFVTGTSSVPFEGFRALKGSSGPKKFNIELWGEPNSLPRSHTCFNRLDLPPYTTYEELFEKLLIAIEEGGTFGIE